MISRVVGYKVNTEKSVTFLYTSNEQVVFEIKNNTICVSTPKN